LIGGIRKHGKRTEKKPFGKCVVEKSIGPAKRKRKQFRQDGKK